ncbi:MAG: 50S ribosomal protein L18, partial [bacterium]
DVSGKTLVHASSRGTKERGAKTGDAAAVGALLAERAGKAKITKVVFDRGSYRYHGRVKALAEAARKGGLRF